MMPRAAEPLTRSAQAPSFGRSMRGRGRPVASVLADSLRGRPEARLALATAAFAEALGWRLAREARLRALTRDGTLLAVAADARWADQLRALAPALLERVNARLGAGAAVALEVRVGPLDPR